MVANASEPVRPHQDVPEVNEQGHRQDQLEEVRDAQIRSNQPAMAKMSTNEPTITIVNTMSANVVPPLGPYSKREAMHSS